MKQPLALPRGSVRALLSLTLVGSTCYLWVTGGIVPDAMLVLDGTALAFYFDTRAQQNAADADVPPPPFTGEEE